ncbi:hypothetical protein ABENE_20095 [Asticcacaulis benevestitus DSM 16100 = ATCC BAA-896]|uniref:Uncharacterized protein n=1 Tax=Asticcacaulis benevestitus DSM 16100 = ATCC BAA-896 TaxID=1121022 RepID=V4P6R9_9CAUL|nr:hypothetical protein ABENE_20095 [Asticcacaulis benevestitus DSM 16100 = ATCC BAA-896]
MTAQLLKALLLRGVLSNDDVKQAWVDLVEDAGYQSPVVASESLINARMQIERLLDEVQASPQRKAG